MFSFICKQGYQGRGFDVNRIDKIVIGKGGVTSENIKEFQNLGFKRVGSLSSIWERQVPIETFKKMISYFESIEMQSK